MKKILLILAALSISACCASPAKEEVVEAVPAPVEAVVIEEVVIVPVPVLLPVTEYVVVPGDTLKDIGEAHNVTWEEISQENNVANPNLIFPGDRLIIPVQY